MLKIRGIMNSLSLLIIATISQLIVYLGSMVVHIYLHQNFEKGIEYGELFLEQNLYIILLLNWLLAIIIFKLMGYSFSVPFKMNYPFSSLISGSLFLGIGLNIFTMSLLSLIDSSSWNVSHFQQVHVLLTEGYFLVGFLALGVIGPIFEEFLFRKFIYYELKEFSPINTILLQGILFGIYHFNIVQAIYASLIGIVLGLLVLWTKDIKASILTHCIINILSFLLARFEIDFLTLHRPLLIIAGLGLISLGLYEFYLCRQL